jgi:hypothetical protein
MRLPQAGATDIAEEMAQVIRTGFAKPYRSAIAA